MAAQETVWMQSPEGEQREVVVDAQGQNLTPLMVAGWKQIEPPAKKPMLISKEIQ